MSSPGFPIMKRAPSESSMFLSHATPFPHKGLKREKIAAKRAGASMVSTWAYIRLKTRRKKS